MSGKSKVTLGLLGALAAGVAIGLLIAPEKGTEIRKRIKKAGNDWADQLSGLINRGEEIAEDVKENSKHLKQAAEEKAKKMKESIA